MTGRVRMSTITVARPRALAKRFAAWATSFPRPVWLLNAATVLEGTGRFMAIPYLSLYLNQQGIGLGIIGVILGAAPAAGVLFGAIGGHLSDHWGRKPVQVIGVAASGLALIGFGLAGTNPYLLGLLNFLNGMTRCFYRPAMTAAIADFSAPERRSEALALNRVAINAAFGWGPLLGVAVFAAAPRYGFFAAGTLSLAVGLFLALAIPESAPEALARRRGSGSVGATEEDRPVGGGAEGISGDGAWASWKAVVTDTGFLVWTAGLILVWGAYDLIQSFLPIHLARKGVALSVYGGLLGVNALVCVFGQLPVSRCHRAAGIGPVAGWSKVLFAAGFLGFAWLRSPVLLAAAMLVLSVGEITGAAVQLRFLPERSPPQLLGRYLGLSVLQDLGKTLVAPLAGFLMEASGGEAVFVGAAVLSLGGGLLLALAPRMAPAHRAATLTASAP
jgi:hypothetical protein